MSAKSRKRLCKIKNKLEKLEQLQLKDVVCSICQSILIEPVTLPCFHDFCQRCFNGSIENNALCCPLCRLRIGSWLRTTTKQNNLVNVKLWKYIESKFSHEIEAKLKGEDLDVGEEIPVHRLSAPGEIRSEYEAELQKLRAERIQQEQKHIQETELLIKKIQQEEKQAQRELLERLRQDELLAQEIQNQETNSKFKILQQKRRKSLRETVVRPKLKPTKIDGYLAKIQAPVAVPLESPLLTDDNTSIDSSSPKTIQANNGAKSPNTESESSISKATSLSFDSSSTNSSVSTKGSTPSTKPSSVKENNRLSPEMVPTYYSKGQSKFNNNKHNSTYWKKSNEKHNKIAQNIIPEEVESSTEDVNEKKGAIKSLLVSLPLPNSGMLHQKNNINKNRTASVDSMHQELCFFKPIEKISPTSTKGQKIVPVRVPGVRPPRVSPSTPPPPPPSQQEPTRTQYLNSLCKLRDFSLASNLPSAFVVVLRALKRKIDPTQHGASSKQGTKKWEINDKIISQPKKLSPNKKTPCIPQNGRLISNRNLRRTRSMNSIVKTENETTPKKMRAIERKVVSDRKPYLRSDSKKLNDRKEVETSPLITKAMNNKVNLAVKNLSSPIKNCDVKQILHEQLRIENMIEQEKKDLEFARQIDAEWNGRRQLRRVPAKRQMTLSYALRPAKKLKA